MSAWRTGKVVFLLVMVALAIPAAVSSRPVQVGDLLVEIARLRGLPAGAAEVAAENLRAAGIELPEVAVGKELTQGDVVAISRAVGIRVATSTPEERFEEREMRAFVRAFHEKLAGRPDVSAARRDRRDNDDDESEESEESDDRKDPKSPSDFDD